MLLPPQFAAPLLAAYAETHFRFFPFFPSLLFRRWPETLFDMPRRLAEGCSSLPVVLVLNDIDRFPVDVQDVALTVSCGDGKTEVIGFGDGSRFAVSHPLDQRCAVYLFSIPRQRLRGERVHVNGRVTLRRGARVEHVLNDNLPGSSKLSLTCVIAKDPLPGQDRCAYGDVHVHSQFSESHVEFGLPVSAIDALAGAYGLDFVGITDHSYDLAARVDDYRRNDPARPRWRLLTQAVSEMRSPATAIVLGEEISCLNSRGKVVHLGGLGMNAFVSGSLDGARPGRQREPQLDIVAAIDRVHAQGGITFAAHPGARVGLLQSLLLARGVWSRHDMPAAMDAFQCVNGGFLEQWRRGRALWLAALRSGTRVPLLAGNDAHGDFNRYRCIGTPFISVRENAGRHLGYTRTGLYGRPAGAGEVLAAIRNGRTFVTSGPYLSIECGEAPKAEVVVGKELRYPNDLSSVRVHAVSTPECGAVREVTLYGCALGEGHERVLGRHTYARNQVHDVSKEFCAKMDGPGYVRAECRAVDTRGVTSFAATSPCYYRPGS